MKKRQRKKNFKNYFKNIALTLKDDEGVIISRDHEGVKNIHGFGVGSIVDVIGDSKWGKQYLECMIGAFSQTIPKECILLKGDKL